MTGPASAIPPIRTIGTGKPCLTTAPRCGRISKGGRPGPTGASGSSWGVSELPIDRAIRAWDWFDPTEVTNGSDETLRVLLPNLAGLRSRVATPEGGPLSIVTTRAAQRQLLSSLDRACISARVAADNKARDVVVLDMRGITPLYDFFVLATGVSRRRDPHHQRRNRRGPPPGGRPAPFHRRLRGQQVGGAGLRRRGRPRLRPRHAPVLRAGRPVGRRRARGLAAGIGAGPGRRRVSAAGRGASC